MGIVLKQSLSNTIVTYIGFAFGAINTLFLYTHFMTDMDYGLVTVILSASALLTPLMAFGVPNTLIKYYSSYTDPDDADRFLTAMLFLPLAALIPLTVFWIFGKDGVTTFLAKRNAVVGGYVWYIYLVGLAMAYFEIFYAWARIAMRSVYGNFMKEIFSRVGQTVLLVLLYFKIITVPVFLMALVGIFVVRMVLMKLYAFKLRMPRLKFQRPDNFATIFNYSALIVIGGSVAAVLLEIDKVMLNQYLSIENVAFYSVASFMAMTIAVPSRSMHQITYPITASLMNAMDLEGLKRLYQKSSLTLFIVSGLLFLLIALNVNDLYAVLPQGYEKGYKVVFWIGLAKVYDAALGNNNAIMYNSDYYKTVLLLGVLLALLAVGLNLWLIPEYGLDGAALASFGAFFIYNTIKLYFVRAKFGMQPFTRETFKVFSLLLFIAILFFPLQFPFHPLVNITIKSGVVVAMYLTVLYRFKISEDVYGVLRRILRREE